MIIKKRIARLNEYVLQFTVYSVHKCMTHIFKTIITINNFL